ncbi:MAG: LacI family DNA-binding transcriptional regulator, partial [Cytophagales bacterium]|nr:LacI family DNA-binding transcriptional regulator [Armatimonadota bacterium]
NGARSNTRVSDATRRRITEIAASLNYSPNALAQGLKRQRTGTLGVLFNWAGSSAIHNPYSMSVLDGIVNGAASEGYHVLLYTESWKNAALSGAVFSDRRTDGIIVVAPDENSGVVPGLVSLGLPVVILSSATAIADVPYVTINNEAGVTLALDHLWGLGHRRIAYVGHGTARHNPRERCEAYQRWMAAHDLPTPGADALAHLPFGSESPSLVSLLSGPDRPTAILALNDDLAVVVLEEARTLGLSLPDELSVVGFDDVIAASLSVPKLTTVRQPLFAMGQQVARLLTQRIEKQREALRTGTGDPEAETALSALSAQTAHIVAPELILRDSTAAPTAL